MAAAAHTAADGGTQKEQRDGSGATDQRDKHRQSQTEDTGAALTATIGRLLERAGVGGGERP